MQISSRANNDIAQYANNDIVSKVKMLNQETPEKKVNRHPYYVRMYK